MNLIIGCVNFNTKIFTELWLKTLYASINTYQEKDSILMQKKKNKLEKIKVVVVNNSPEESLNGLKDKYYGVTFIENSENIGVAAAWNQIIKEGYDENGEPLYDYYIPCNNDIYFTHEWLINFIDCLSQDTLQEYAWISSFMNDYKEPDLTGVNETVGIENIYWGRTRPDADDVNSIEQMEGVIKSTYAISSSIELFSEVLKRKYGVKLKTMHPKAPLFALSKKCLKKIGLFDEYNSPIGLHEDADYCKRIELAGMKTGAAYGAYIHHFSMMSRTKGEFKKEWWVETREKAFKEKWGVSSKEMHLISKDKKFKLDIGSGERPRKDGHFYHMDIDKQFLDIEFLGDITKNLPFEDFSISYLYASNILEHVEWKEVYPTLYEWHRILSNQGKIHIRVPNFRFAVERYLDRTWHISLEQNKERSLMHLLMGGDHPGYPHLHKVVFDFENLGNVLKDIGFTCIKDVSEPGSWELRVEAIKT